MSRHLAGDFARFFAQATAAFLALFLVVTFFEKLKLFLKFRASVTDAAAFLAGRIPWITCQVAPLAVLVATLLSVTLLSRHGEITAFRCGGVSLRKLTAPYLACSLLVSLFGLLLQEFVVPAAATHAREVEDLRIRKRSARGLARAGNLWLRAGNRFIHVEKVVPEQDRLLAVSLVEVEGGRVTQRVDAREAFWTQRGWVLRDAERRDFTPSGATRTERAAEMPYPLSDSPQDFEVAKLDVQEMPWPELRRLIRRYRAQGLDADDLEVGLWAKTSIPFASFVMALLGFPFALRAGRRGGTSLGVALGVGIGFVYWLTLALGLSLAKAGTLPAPLGAWIGNIVFGAAGAALLWRAEGVR